MSKKIILIFLLSSFLLLLFSSFCLAQRKLEIIYPAVPGVQTPTTTKTALPEYLRYVFTFAIIISGLVAFGAMIYGGVLYVTSVGDPTKISGAKDQVIAGILGLIIVLSSFLILNTINPQLVLPASPPLESASAGIYAYVKAGCVDAPDDSYDDRVLISQTEIPDLGVRLPTDEDGDPQSLKCLEFRSQRELIAEVKVLIYSQKATKSDSKWIFPDTPSATHIFNPGEKWDVPVAAESMKLEYHPAGVYLYTTLDCKGDKYGTDYVIYQGSSATLQDFDNKTQSIKFLYGDKDPDTLKYQVKFAAILHEKENYMGQAMLYDQDQNVCKKLSENLTGNPNAPKNITVSSITVYLKPVGSPIGQGVRFWEDKNNTGCVLPETGFYGANAVATDLDAVGYKKCGYDQGQKKCNKNESCNDRISSMEMDGHYIALLFREKDFKDDCEVFTESKPDFRPFRIGQCGWLGRSDCLTSFIIKARK